MKRIFVYFHVIMSSHLLLSLLLGGMFVDLHGIFGSPFAML